MNGCNPAPTLRAMLGCSDPLVANADVVAALGGSTKAVRRAEQIKNMLRFQDTTAKKEDVEGEFKDDKVWLCRPLFSSLLGRCREGVILGKNVSLDEIDIGTTAPGELSQRIKFKKEGDGILLDAICSSFG